VRFENPETRKFTLKKEIQFESKDQERADWRRIVCEHHSTI
jgi:hypothetical protein